MYDTNSMKVTLKNKKAATNALEILKNRLAAGFDCDNNYKNNPSEQMAQKLIVKGKSIMLPDDYDCYFPEDAESVIPELMQDLAAHLSTETFSFDACNSSDYDEVWVKGSYANGELKVKTTYLPSGFDDFYCQECDEVIATMEDDEEGNIYIECDTHVCPECGEEVDLSDWLPVITEKTFQIV